MKCRTRTYYAAAQKALMWERWEEGWMLHEIGKLFDRRSKQSESCRRSSTNRSPWAEALRCMGTSDSS